MIGILIGKLAMNSSRMIGNSGTDIGGLVALKFNKKIFAALAKNIETIILVTGTNGKSTTTNIIASVLEGIDNNFIDNRKGANMYTGILSSMIDDYKLIGNNKFKYGVFEVDEGSIPKVMKDVDAKYLVVTNFFRDQLDRYSEMDMLVDRIHTAVKNSNVKLVLNVDDPFCMRLGDVDYVGYGMTNEIDVFEEGSVSDSRFCFKCGDDLIYEHNFYGQLGHYVCNSCDFERSTPKYDLSMIAPASVLINDTEYSHNLSGDYNAYNILAAISLCHELGISNEDIQKGLSNYHSNDGRMTKYDIDNKDVYLNLVKNPAGMNMTLQEARKLDINHLCFILNDGVVDGRDVSWIWDADFEYLLEKDFDKIFCSGTRAYDMALRLKNIGIPREKLLIDNNFEVLVDAIVSKNALVVASYTALQPAKKALEKKVSQ